MREKIYTNDYLHIYLRGSEQKDIFLTEEDYYRFLNTLKYCNRKDSLSFSNFLKKNKSEIKNELSNYIEDLGEILITTLMPNHFHILIKCLEENSVGKLMQKTLTSYSLYFNKKYSKQGHRFESKYKYRKIKDNADLLNTIDYIYKNPAKLLDKNYKHINIINGSYKLSLNQEDFIKKYPFTFQGPTLELDLG